MINALQLEHTDLSTLTKNGSVGDAARYQKLTQTKSNMLPIKVLHRTLIKTFHREGVINSSQKSPH